MTTSHAAALIVLFTAWISAPFVQAQSQGDDAPPAIVNPYYEHPQWKIWNDREQDPLPGRMYYKRPLAPQIKGSKEFSIVDFGHTRIRPVPPADRLYPDDVSAADAQDGVFLAYRTHDWPGRKYAGFWNDLYSSYDAHHSYIPRVWSDAHNRVELWTDNWPYPNNHFMHMVVGDLKHFGINFMSASVYGMDGGGFRYPVNQENIEYIEQKYYFANTVRFGPCYLAYEDRYLDHSTYTLEAYSPGLAVAFGQSGSSTPAMIKCVIAGGYLPKAIKPELKKNGLYALVLSHIWKKALPYQVGDDNELKHRMAYAASGHYDEGHKWSRADINLYYHAYDESAHLANMVKLAKAMTTVPPVALIDLVDVQGGQAKADAQTTILVDQDQDADASLTVDLSRSYDLQNLPIHFRYNILHGHPQTKVERLGPARFRITVPHDKRFPQGSTTVIFVPDNGVTDGPAAAVNIYNPHGSINQRPSLEGLTDQVIHPGETLTLPITSIDPEGFPTIIYQWAGEVGELKNTGDQTTFTWACPRDQKPGVYPVTLIASDHCTGYSYNSGRANITVSPAIARIDADVVHGTAPLKVQFSSKNSSDISGPVTATTWDFSDGQTSTDANPVHTFAQPGRYRVTLTVEGPSGSHTAAQWIEVDHAWPLRVTDGWRADADDISKPAQLDPAVWRSLGNPKNLTFEKAKYADVAGLRLTRDRSEDATGVALRHPPAPPFYVEIEYDQHNPDSGCGFTILGHLFGDPRHGYRGYSRGRSNMSFSDEDLKNTAQLEPNLIGHQTRYDNGRALLQLYVTPDPQDPERLRYSGQLVLPQGAYPFAFDKQIKRADNFDVALVGSSSYLSLYSFKLWRPAGDEDSEPHDAAAPSLAISGDDLPILVDDSRPALRNATQLRTPAADQPVTQTYRIRNQGTAPLEIQAIRADASGPFTADAALPLQLAPQESAAFTVTYKPASQGWSRGQIVLVSNDPQRPEYRINLAGFCGRPGYLDNAAPDPSQPATTYRFAKAADDLRIKTSDQDGAAELAGDNVSFDFGATPRRLPDGRAESAVEQTFYITNPGATPINLRETPAAITGADTGDFVIVHELPEILPPNYPAPLRIVFYPQSDQPLTQPSPRHAELCIGATRLQLQGVAAPEPALQIVGQGGYRITPDAGPHPYDGTDFGDVGLHRDQAARTFTLHNAGYAPLHLASAVIEPAGETCDFMIVAQPDATIAPGGDSQLVIRFDPKDLGPQDAKVVLKNSEKQPIFAFPLHAVAAPFVANTDKVGDIYHQSSLHPADLNHDDRIDLVYLDVRRERAYVRQLINRGDKQFAEENLNVPQGRFDYGAARWGDFDNDGDLDFFFSGLEGRQWVVKLFECVEGNRYQLAFTFPSVVAARFAAADFDNDGQCDVAISGLQPDGENIDPRRGVTTIYRQTDHFKFQAEPVTFPGSYAGIEAVDFNHDNRVDLAVLETPAPGANTDAEQAPAVRTLLLQNTPDGFVPFEHTLPPVRGGAMAWADVDRDGDMDLALSGWYDGHGSVGVFVNDGSGRFTEQRVTTAGVVQSAIHFADLNGDGLADLIVTGVMPDNTDIAISMVFLADGEGRYRFYPTQLDSAAGASITTADLNGDGAADIIFAGRHLYWGDLMRIYWNYGFDNSN